MQMDRQTDGQHHFIDRILLHNLAKNVSDQYFTVLIDNWKCIQTILYSLEYIFVVIQ